MSLQQKLCQLTLIEDWYKLSDDTKNLYGLFSGALGGSGSNVFLNIYVSIRHNPENSQEEETEVYNYYNVGFTPLQISQYFYLRFGLNYFAYNPSIPGNFDELKNNIQII